MKLSSNERFQQHPAARIQEAAKLLGTQSRGGEHTSNKRCVAAWQDIRVILDKPCTAQAGRSLPVHFVSDRYPEVVLQEVLQASACGLPFCVIPEEADQTELIASEVSDVESDAVQLKPASVDLPQFQCMSAGSAGTARRIQRSHQSWIRSFQVNAALMQISPEDRYAIVGRFSHSLPLYAALEACHLGADVQLLSDLRPDRQLQAMAVLGTTVLYLTPTQARQLCRVPSVPEENRFRVRHLLCGGGKLDEKTRAALQQRFKGANIVEFYGAAETSFITMSTEQTPAGSVGSAYPGVSISIRDAQGVPVSGTGEIWVKSDYLFAGYASGRWRDTREQGGYLSIGEAGRLDEAGYLYLSGRQSRRANVADVTVFLQEIEEVMLQHAAVHHCVVMAKPDGLRGEILIAVVEGRFDASLQTDLLKHARRKLGAILAPRQILFLEPFPMLIAGKPDLRKIQACVDKL